MQLVANFMPLHICHAVYVPAKQEICFDEMVHMARELYADSDAAAMVNRCNIPVSTRRSCSSASVLGKTMICSQGCTDAVLPGVLEGSQSNRLFFLEVLHLLVESSALCDLLQGALADVPKATQALGRANMEPEPHRHDHVSQHDVSR